MSSRYIINLVLVSLILGFYWFLQQPEKTTNPHNYQRLTTLSQSEINRIEIIRADYKTIVLEKQNKQWQINQPIQAKANNTRVRLILSLLSVNSFAQLPLQDEAEAARFGLGDTSITLRLNDAEFRFGEQEPLSNNRYLLHNNMVHLIDDQVSQLLNSSVSSFIENRLFDNTLNIVAIDLPIQQNNETLSSDMASIEQRDGHWQSEQLSLSSDALTSLMDSWQHAYAIQVIPVTNSGKTNNNLEVQVQLSNQSTRVFGVSNNASTLSLIDKQSQLKYQFPITSLRQFFPTIAEQ